MALVHIFAKSRQTSCTFLQELATVINAQSSRSPYFTGIREGLSPPNYCRFCASLTTSSHFLHLTTKQYSISECMLQCENTPFQEVCNELHYTISIGFQNLTLHLFNAIICETSQISLTPPTAQTMRSPAETLILRASARACPRRIPNLGVRRSYSLAECSFS